MKHLLLLSLLLFACMGYAQTKVELIDKQSDMEGTPRRKAFPTCLQKKLLYPMQYSGMSCIIKIE